MTKTRAFLMLILFLLNGFAQEDESIQGKWIASPVSKQAAKQAEAQLFRDLVARRVVDAQLTAIDIVMDDEDWRSMDTESEGMVPIGLTKSLDVRVELGSALGFSTKRTFEASFGMARYEVGRLIWTAMIGAEEARGIRLNLSDFNLPEGAALYVYSDLGQAFGPYTGLGPSGKGSFWTDTVFGEAIWLQLEVDGKVDPERLAFTVGELAYFNERFRLGAAYVDHAYGKACQGSGGLGSCFENVRCHDGSDLVDHLMEAVAWFKYKDDANGNWYGCTGSLINGSGATDDYPWFLTAAHCVNSSTEADSMVAYFDYKTSNCTTATGSCSSAFSNATSVSGAQLHATNNASNADYSLLKLPSFPNGYSWSLGWNAGDYSDNDGETLYRVSHPKHYPQNYTEHEVDTAIGTCYNNPRPTYIYTRHTLGYTEGGSSGSPLVNSSAQIVGTDRGRCSDTTCNDNIAVRDGHFRYQFYDKLRPFIKPTDIHVENIVVTEEANGPFYQAKAEVQVLDNKDVPVSGALIHVLFTGPSNFLGFGITGSDGWATVTGFPFSVSGTWTGCTQAIIHPWLTWDPSEDVESCDSN